MQLNPTEHIQQQLFWYGCYEKELGDLIKKILKPGNVFLDVGANIGYFSLLAAKHEPTARIIAFEPVTTVFKRLEKNIELNAVQNIKAIHSAVGEKNEKKEIYVSAGDNLGMSSFHQPGNYSGQSEITNVITIDEWFPSSGLSKVDIIKIDVEGSELAVLRGMDQTLRQFKPAVIVEINPGTLLPFHLGADDIFRYLDRLDFIGFLVTPAGKLEQVTNYPFPETNNVLFVHNEQRNLYDHLS